MGGGEEAVSCRVSGFAAAMQAAVPEVVAGSCIAGAAFEAAAVEAVEGRIAGTAAEENGTAVEERGVEAWAEELEGCKLVDSGRMRSHFEEGLGWDDVGWGLNSSSFVGWCFEILALSPFQAEV